jgi:multiple sugar transport system ATP-binding protein
LAQRVRTHSGDALTAGIRPEHLSLDKGGAGALPVRIEVVEPVGNETFIHFSVGAAGGPYVCRTQAATLPRAGETSTLFADTTRLHLFDPATGSAL